MQKMCENCGAAFNVPKVGRPKRFCHGRCRVMAHRRGRLVQIPPILLGFDRWVGWKPVCRGSQWGKMPIQVGGGAASSVDSNTWGAYKDVSAVFDRVGFVLGVELGGKHVVCVDLDNCFLEDGGLTVGAVSVLKRFPKTWVEVSPSGSGLHVWGVVDWVPERCVYSVEGQSVEVYVDKRYMSVTGVQFGVSSLVLSDLSDNFSFVS